MEYRHTRKKTSRQVAYTDKQILTDALKFSHTDLYTKTDQETDRQIEWEIDSEKTDRHEDWDWYCTDRYNFCLVKWDRQTDKDNVINYKKYY